MNFKTTYALFGVLVGVLGVFLLTQLFGKRSQDQDTYVLPSLHDVTTPVRAEDIVRVDSNLVSRIVDQVTRVRKEETADMTPDLKKFGLDAPGSVVTLHRKDSD